MWLHCQAIGSEEERRRRTEVGELSYCSKTHGQGPVRGASQLMNRCIILLVSMYIFKHSHTENKL